MKIKKFYLETEIVQKAIQKALTLQRKEFEEMIDKIFPKCICDGNNTNKDCPNEWVECWTKDLNEELKSKLQGGKNDRR